MLSLRLWRALDALPLYVPLHKVFIPKQSHFLPNFLLEFVGLSVFCLCTVLPIIILPILMSLLCLNTALQIAVTLAHQRELERYDLLALTPIGALGGALEISRVHTNSPRENIEVARNFGGTIVIVVMTWGILLFIATLFGSQATVPEDTLFTALFGFLVVVVALYHDCRQSLILGMVVGILAGCQKDRLTARLWALGGYLGIQCSLYGVTGVLFVALMDLFRLVMVYNIEIKLLSVMVGVTVWHFSARETIIFLVWRRLNEDLNDDLPTMDKGKWAQNKY